MKNQPIFRKIAVPVTILMLLEIVIFVCTMFGQGLIGELQRNEIEVVNEKVTSRHGNLENIMFHDWMNVSSSVERINETTEEVLQSEGIDIQTLIRDNEKTAQLLELLAPGVSSAMQIGHTTGAYVILNTDDLRPSMESGEYQNKQGVYLRNNDPTSRALDRGKNILMLRSPISVVQDLDIPMASSWDVNFDFAGENVPYYDFLYRPFQMAYEHASEYNWSDMGCWSKAYRLENTDQDAITYSVPLILSDGSVYGVFGIDITLEYLQSELESQELNGFATYFIGIHDENEDVYRSVFGYSNENWIAERDDQLVYPDTDNYYFHSENLRLYKSNAPFSSEQWVLAAAVPYNYLYRFVRTLVISLGIAVILTMGLGVFGSVVMSYQIQLPIARLAQEMQEKDPRDYIQLQPTGIREIDQLSGEVEHLTGEILENSQKFSVILKMASTWIAGFQVNEAEQTLFISEEFFEIFDLKQMDTRRMTVPQFYETLQSLEQYRVESDETTEGTLYRIIVDGGRHRFVQLKVTVDGNNRYGLAEDITSMLLEKKILTHERDHDALTNLYNRRAFRRKLRRLFEQQADQIKVGAFLMMDLDNLKYVNDTYGHDYGDRYIRQAAAILDQCVGNNGIYARISGDEFNLFLYGFDTVRDVEAQIEVLREQFAAAVIMLPDGSQKRVQVSCGVAWYPKDSTYSEELARYADFAMYVVKKKHKGDFAYFDRNLYQSPAEQLKNASALTHLIENREVYYAFQPIIDAHTGEVFAYEALMRSRNEVLTSVGAILSMARQEGKLNQIEELTWTLAMQKYVTERELGTITPETCIFINSIPNQRMSSKVGSQFLEQYYSYVPNIILELTEDEQIDGEIWNDKREKLELFGGRIALDDYGTGYNGEQALLSILPHFIKIDIAIVRGIDQDEDKQTMFEYAVDFAGKHNMRVIAEGIETEEELRTVIRLGADLLQGFYLARPNEVPQQASDVSLAVIQSLQQDEEAPESI